MPYKPAFEHALRAIAHGFKPASKSLSRITKEKAQAMLDEAESKKSNEGGYVAQEAARSIPRR